MNATLVDLTHAVSKGNFVDALHPNTAGEHEVFKILNQTLCEATDHHLVDSSQSSQFPYPVVVVSGILGFSFLLLLCASSRQPARPQPILV